MGEQRSVRNEFSGEATGLVVQVGNVGRIIVNPPPSGLPTEGVAVHQRLRVRKARRRMWWYVLLACLCCLSGPVHLLSKAEDGVPPFGLPETPPLELMVAWGAVTVTLLLLGNRASRQARTAHR